MAAKQFLLKPSVKFFEKERFSLKKLKSEAKKYGVKLITLKTIPLKGKQDVVGSKLLKSYTHIKKHLILNEFQVVKSGWEWNKDATFWYMVYPESLPKSQKHIGPLIYSAPQHVQEFIKKHKGFMLENSRLYTLRKRKFLRPEALVKYLVKDLYFRDKVKKLSIIKI